jgi:hypothetical protein
MVFFFQELVNGITNGALYALVAPTAEAAAKAPAGEPAALPGGRSPKAVAQPMWMPAFVTVFVTKTPRNEPDPVRLVETAWCCRLRPA